jgi:hypothetical protein
LPQIHQNQDFIPAQTIAGQACATVETRIFDLIFSATAQDGSGEPEAILAASRIVNGKRSVSFSDKQRVYLIG